MQCLRQRNAMTRSLCQVCRVPLPESGHVRVLFLVKGGGNQPIAEGERTSAPPVGERCAPIAALDCPRLRTGYAAAWVTYSMAWGVAGTVYDMETLRPVPGMELVEVSYASPLIRHVVACRMVETLLGCTPVDLSDLRAAEPFVP